MNLREANLEAQRRWGPCGCAWYEASGGPRPYAVGVLTPLGQAMLGQGPTLEMAFDAVLAPLMCGMPEGFKFDDWRPKTDDRIRDMAAPSPDLDPKHRLAVMRVEAAMGEACRMLGVNMADVPIGAVSWVATITGFILAERARL